MAFLSLLTSPHGLPVSESATLAPGGAAHLQGLWTSTETKASLKNATASFLAVTAEKTKAKSKGSSAMRDGTSSYPSRCSRALRFHHQKTKEFYRQLGNITARPCVS